MRCNGRYNYQKRCKLLCRGEQVPCTVPFENLISLPQGPQPSAKFLKNRVSPAKWRAAIFPPSLQLVPILSSGRSIIKRSVRTSIEDFIGLLFSTSFSIFSSPCFQQIFRVVCPHGLSGACCSLDWTSCNGPSLGFRLLEGLFATYGCPLKCTV